MSFFPHPDPIKLRAAMTHNYTIYQQPQAPSSSSRRSRAVPHPTAQWPSSADSCPPTQSMGWTSDEPRGLGLMSLPVSSEGYYAGSNTVTSSGMGDSMAWTSSAEMVSNHGIARKDSAIDHCHPLSTLLPASALWNTLPPNTNASMLDVHETSPGRSEHSTASSRPSIVSSPYTQPEHLYPNESSPSIKVEDPVDASGSGYHYMPSAMAFDRSMHAAANGLLDDPSVATSAEDMAGYLATASQGSIKADYHTSNNSETNEARSRASSHISQATSFDSNNDDSRPQKRSFTTVANSTCACEQCGKLFQRSYNLKAHMETHDPNRDQPHACEYPHCRRRFVRRTDLLRHEQSVHLKIRNYPCPMCSASFARKDTLRRHVEDGCPKRPEVKKRGSKPSSSARRRSDSRVSSVSSSHHPSSLPAAAAAAAAAASYAMDHGYPTANMTSYY